MVAKSTTEIRMPKCCSCSSCCRWDSCLVSFLYTAFGFKMVLPDKQEGSLPVFRNRCCCVLSQVELEGGKGEAPFGDKGNVGRRKEDSDRTCSVRTNGVSLRRRKVPQSTLADRGGFWNY